MWIIVLTVSIAFFHLSDGLQCYQCTAQRPQRKNVTETLCSNFDTYSPKFQVECPSSTFCMKKNYTLELPDGRRAVVTERGCAPQMEQHLEHQDGKWKEITHLRKDAYKEGCQIEDLLDKPKSFCFCSTYLCNTGSTRAFPCTGPAQVLGVWLVFLTFAQCWD